MIASIINERRITVAIIKAIRFRNYKSYADEYSCIDMDKRITVFIGRNNCGKSSCIDIIESLSNVTLFQKNHCDLIFDILCQREDLKRMIKSNVSIDSKELLDKYAEKAVSIKLNASGESFKYDPIYDERSLSAEKPTYESFQLFEGVAVFLEGFIGNIILRRLNAERDIIPEPYSEDGSLLPNGNGSCSLINLILNRSTKDETIVQKDLLEALNSIMYPDSNFEGITVQKVSRSKDYWEVYLYERGKRFPLSKTGSGLKTIILVLLNLLIIPKLTSFSDSKMWLFAFEELENNLHPALQRRLFDYIDRYVKKHKNVHIYLTTHSHIAINTFADNADAQILHIVKNNGVSTIHKIDDFISKCELLDDLDVRASDLLQSNGIIWVEGPSDRVYIKRWLDIVSDKSVIEGRDYQFLYYGGRLLSHYSAEDQAADNNLISILTTNRNSAIVIDSDKKAQSKSINDTKKRIKDEFEKLRMLCWITKGREIENYVPFQAINSAFDSKLNKQCEKYESFPEYISSVRSRFSNEKVLFANKVCPYISESNYGVLDVKENVKKLYEMIKAWNNN